MKREGKDEDMLLRSRIAGAAEVPRELLLSLPVLTATGRQEIRVENYRGILEYTPNSIVLQSKTCRIAFCGCGLRIAYYTNEDMKIEGKISEIRYL